MRTHWPGSPAYVHVPTEVVAGIANQIENFLQDDASKSPAPRAPAQSDAGSLIDQLQQLLDAAKASPRDPRASSQLTRVAI
jgi:cell division septation protein DedD